VGETGRVIGVDMTPEMGEKALYATARTAVVGHFRSRLPRGLLPDDLTGRSPQECGGPTRREAHA